MKLKKEKFGRTDYRVSRLCLSTSHFSRYASQEESFAILDSFRDADGNFIQTSGICPSVNLGDGFLGMPEEVLGRWLKLRRIERASIIIATWIAFTRPVIGGLATYTELIRLCAGDCAGRRQSPRAAGYRGAPSRRPPVELGHIGSTARFPLVARLQLATRMRPAPTIPSLIRAAGVIAAACAWRLRAVCPVGWPALVP